MDSPMNCIVGHIRPARGIVTPCLCTIILIESVEYMPNLVGGYLVHPANAIAAVVVGHNEEGAALCSPRKMAAGKQTVSVVVAIDDEDSEGPVSAVFGFQQLL